MSGIIKLTLPDSKVIEAEKSSTAFDIVGKIGKGLQKAALAVKVNGDLRDLSYKVENDALLHVITFDSPEGKDIFWHSASHLMAQAVKRIYPGAKIAIGPAIENGFYYDFDIEERIAVEDFEKIEAEMKKIADENFDIIREELSSADAVKFFEKINEPYKAEMIKDLGADTVSIYKQGEFTDLCRGPHLAKTGAIKSFKLLSLAGAYWRGDEKNRMLQRIYGTAFPDPKDLKKHLDFLEEIKKRDHRKLGKDLDLYSTHEDAGGGLIYWHPKGARIRSILEDWWRQEHFAGGYELLYTPHVGRSTLWETSGHLDFYSENMYSPMDVDGNEYYIKPMNCPFHIKIYQTSLHSYRDLPLRWAELGTVYRYEKSGVLHGLLRVRGFTQDDAHIFCTEAQIESEVAEVLRFSLRMWKILGFTDIKAYLATKPEKSVGDNDKWETAKNSLMKAVESENLNIEIDEGGGAFYGPKIDLKVRDALGREWQMTTIQFDFNLPERFDIYYIGEDGQKQRPYMVHRALLGSLERFFGILIEHYAGKFPVWLSPVQAVLINVTEEQENYLKDIKSRMLSMNMRPSLDLRNESIGYKIKAAIGQKVPYICVAGNKEVESGNLSVRKRGENDSKIMSVDEFLKILKEEADSKE